MSLDAPTSVQLVRPVRIKTNQATMSVTSFAARTSLILLCLLTTRIADTSAELVVGVSPDTLNAPPVVRRIKIDETGVLHSWTVQNAQVTTESRLHARRTHKSDNLPTVWYWTAPYLVYLNTLESESYVKELCYETRSSLMGNGYKMRCAQYALHCRGPTRLGAIVRDYEEEENQPLTLLVELDKTSPRPLHAHVFLGTNSTLSIATDCLQCSDLLPAMRLFDPVERNHYLLMQAVDRGGAHRKTIWVDSYHNEVMVSEGLGLLEPEVFKIKSGRPREHSKIWTVSERPQLNTVFARGLRLIGDSIALRGPAWTRYCNITASRSLIDSCSSRHDERVSQEVSELLDGQLSWETAVHLNGSPMLDEPRYSRTSSSGNTARIDDSANRFTAPQKRVTQSPGAKAKAWTDAIRVEEEIVGPEDQFDDYDYDHGNDGKARRKMVEDVLYDNDADEDEQPNQQKPENNDKNANDVRKDGYDANAGYDANSGYDDENTKDGNAGYDGKAGYDANAGYDDENTKDGKVGYDGNAGYDGNMGGYDGNAGYDGNTGDDDENAGYGGNAGYNGEDDRANDDGADGTGDTDRNNHANRADPADPADPDGNAQTYGPRGIDYNDPARPLNPIEPTGSLGSVDVDVKPARPTRPTNPTYPSYPIGAVDDISTIDLMEMPTHMVDFPAKPSDQAEPSSPYSITLLILIMTASLIFTAFVVAFFSLRLHRRTCFWRKRRPYIHHAQLNDPHERRNSYVTPIRFVPTTSM